MHLDQRLFMELRKNGEKWIIRYATRAGHMVAVEALADTQTKELPSDVMQFLRGAILTSERSSATVVIDRRISEIYHTALLKGRKQLQEFEELMSQAG